MRPMQPAKPASVWYCGGERVIRYYLLGMLTFGLGAIIGPLLRFCRRDRSVNVHARQALLLNWGCVILFMAVTAIMLTVGALGQIGASGSVLYLSWYVRYSTWLFAGLVVAVNGVALLLAVRRNMLLLKLQNTATGDAPEETDPARMLWADADRVALCYAIGAFTFGLGVLLIMRHPESPAVRLHARRAIAINLALLGLLAIVPPACFVLQFGLAMFTEAPPILLAVNPGLIALIGMFYIVPIIWSIEWHIVYKAWRGARGGSGA
jgi:uncharacterized membrane protein